MKKKILFILLIGIVGIMSIQCSKESKQAKNKKSYEVKSYILYSDDAGITYKDNIKEFKVGKTVYMKVSIEITERNPKNFVGYVGGGTAAGAGAGAVAGSFIPVIGNIVGAIGGAVVGGAVGVGAYFMSKPYLDFVECKLMIPNITSVDAKYYDGTAITPLIDGFAGITTYPLNVRVSAKKEENPLDIEWSYTFQFIPNKESEISVKLIFDDNIAEQYDRMNTIRFVK